MESHFQEDVVYRAKFVRMIAINEVYDFVTFIVNKNASGSFTPRGFNLAAKAANIELFDDLRGGRYSTYHPGRPVPTVGMEENMTLSTELDPFIKPTTLTIANGIANFPTDFAQCIAVQLGSKKVEWVRKEELPDHLDSAIDPVSPDMPIFTNIGNSWEFYPSTMTSVKLYYLKVPTDPKYNYIANGLKTTYNPTGSVHFEWNKTAFMALVAKILSHLGINLSNEQITGYSENLKSEVK